MAFAAVVFCSIVATASGAASIAEIIDVPHTVVYQQGTLGTSSSLLEGEAAKEREAALSRMSMLSFEVKEQILEDGKDEQGILAPHRKPSTVSSALQSEGLGNAFEILEEHGKPELRKALKIAMMQKEQKVFDHMTLEETLAKQEMLKEKLKSAGQQFADLFEEVSTRYTACQQCLNDCPAHNYETYYGITNEKDCMRNCELVVCKENWNPLAGSYEQQLAMFQKSRQQQQETAYAKPSLFTTYLDDYLLKKGEASMFYEDEDEDTEIVYETTPEQLQKDEEHDRQLERFTFVFTPGDKAPASVPHFDLRRVSSKKEGDVYAMEPPEDEAAKRLSITAREAELLSKSQAF